MVSFDSTASVLCGMVDNQGCFKLGEVCLRKEVKNLSANCWGQH